MGLSADQPESHQLLGWRLVFQTVHGLISHCYLFLGMAAIHEAVLSGNLDCVMLLMKHGADLQQRDAEGWTPLHMACSDSFPDIAR